MARLTLPSILGLALMLPLPVGAESPSGGYVIAVGGTESILLPTEIDEETCETADGVTVCFSGAISTDGAGTVTGSALMEVSGDLEGELEAILTGVVRGSSEKTKVRLAMDMTGELSSGGVTLDFEAKGRFKCVESAAAGGFACRGKLKLCAFDGGQRVGCESERLDLDLEADGGSWELRLLDLATDDSGAVSGNAEVELATGEILTYDVLGKYSERKDTAKLRLLGTGDATGSQLKLSKVSLEGGSATGGKLAFRIAGQKGKTELLAPPFPALIPAFLGPPFSGHGSYIRGGFADVNGDTADLFNVGHRNPEMPFNNVIFFGALGGASRTR